MPDVKDVYRTLTHPGEAVYTEKRSRFLAFAYHVDTEDDVRRITAELRKKYYDARHVCYAYVLGFDGGKSRANDDGEPSGSAGKPILGRLRALDVTFTLIVVVRYFGGVKLGTGGLAVAYKTAAAAALDAAVIEEKIVKTVFRVRVPYADADVAMRFVREGMADIVERDYTDTCTLLAISVRLCDEPSLRERLGKILSLAFIDDDESETK